MSSLQGRKRNEWWGGESTSISQSIYLCCPQERHDTLWETCSWEHPHLLEDSKFSWRRLEDSKTLSSRKRGLSIPFAVCPTTSRVRSWRRRLEGDWGARPQQLLARGKDLWPARSAFKTCTLGPKRLLPFWCKGTEESCTHAGTAFCKTQMRSLRSEVIKVTGAPCNGSERWKGFLSSE